MDYMLVFFANYLGYILLVIFLFLFLKGKTKAFFFVPLISALISRFVFTEIIRFFYFRPRPFAEQGFAPLIDHAPSASFPSGHAAFFFALAAGIYYYDKKAGLWFFAASAAIGLARVFAGVHYFTDVLAGLALGVFSFWLVKSFYGRTEEKVIGICAAVLDQTVRKNRNKEEIVKLLEEKKEISNSDIREHLGIADRTAVKYMDELEREGKAVQVGDTGRGVFYRLK